MGLTMLNKERRKRGVHRIKDLYANSERRTGSECWWWLGAVAKQNGRPCGPRIWTFDHERKERRVLSGPKAVYNIANNAAPPEGMRAYMTCCNSDCVNPKHNAAGSQKTIGKNISDRGVWKGKHIPQRRECARKALASRGIEMTPEDVVLTIRAAPKNVTGRSLARQLGLSDQIVSRIRRRQSHRTVVAP